ncbi:MAG: FAD-dependent oxidoreductase [Spirochaetota bacterium]
MDHYEVAIIGAGVSGAAVARRLSAYDLSVALVEREVDVSFGTSKANSGIIHGGFHHNRSYLKAQLEIQGAGMYPQLHRELGFPYRRCGIVVAAFTPEELVTAEHLYRQGVENDSAGIELCGAERIRELEPKLHPDVIGGLYAPAGGIIEPYRFVFALVENAEENGLTVLRDFEVIEIERKADGFSLRAGDGRSVVASYVVNAAGLYADSVSRLAGAESFEIHPRKGEYHLLDRRTVACPDRVVFPVPTQVSKGMLVIPTVEGTVLIGPTADPVDDKSDLATHRDRMQEIVASAQQLVPSVSAGDIIASFSGLRPALEDGDFLIRESETVPGFIQVAGIQSPGLTAAPAVAEYVKDLLKAAGCTLTERPRFRSALPPVRRTRTMPDEEVRSRWEASRDAGAVVCRCETVTREEIRRAIAAGHTTVDGIKFYSRASAGRCQGGFCIPRVLEIIAEETGVPVTEITKRGRGSELVDRTLPGTPAKRARRDDGPASAPVARAVSSVREADAIVVGGGAAGLATASELAGRGYEPLVVDRDHVLGGVLRQCVHNGFGIHEFGEELTGPEYAERYVDEIAGAAVGTLTDTTVLGIARDGDRFLTRMLSRDRGLEYVRSRAVALAMGSRERNRGSIQIPGTRPSGVMTAGAAQRLINIEGFVPGKRAVVIGSGDIGLIMARRFKLIGSDVEAVVEIQPVPSGINRNIVQCLDDFNIPLYLGHVVTSIHGEDRVGGVTVAPLENGVPRSDRSFFVECDTVLLSVGLIPENELSRELGVDLHRQTGGPVVDSRLMTSVPGVFASGNVLHIHDLVDFVAEESRRCGRAIADYLDGAEPPPEADLVAGSNVRYVAPGRVRTDAKNRIYLRSLISKVGAVVEVTSGGTIVARARQHHVQPSEMISITVDGSRVEPGSRVEVSLA